MCFSSGGGAKKDRPVTPLKPETEIPVPELEAPVEQATPTPTAQPKTTSAGTGLSIPQG
jgi:hypothetical protein